MTVSVVEPDGSHPRLLGDADVARPAALFSEPTRARVLLALTDGRALPASVLATETGVSAQAMSMHLSKLLDGGLVVVERNGRYRNYRLAGPAVAEAVEALARLSPPQPIRSLREGTRARAMRRSRTCYDHLAGELAVDIAAVLLQRAALVREDGEVTTVRRSSDPWSSHLQTHPYRLGASAPEVFGELGVDLDAVVHGAKSKRPLLRFCVDWSEQQHHLAGRLGAAVADALLRDEWVERLPRCRALRVTDKGSERLSELGCLRSRAAA